MNCPSKSAPKHRLARSWPALIALLIGSTVCAQPVPEDSPVADALMRATEAVDRIVAIPPSERTFENTIGAIDDLIVRLEIDTGMPMFMAYVSTDAAERDRGAIAEEHVTNWMIELGKREDLYRSVKALSGTSPDLSGEQARVLEFTLRDYRREGMDLDTAQRSKLKEVQKEIARLGIEFERNIRDDETRVPLTAEELTGMPAEFLAGLPSSGDLYLVGMDYPTFLPIMDYAENETTREKVWLAYKRRGGKKNVEILEKILKLRAEAATLLGYAHPADYEIEIKMAKDAETVRAFYQKLRPLVRQKALLDWKEYLAAKRAHTGDANATFHPWDQSFYDKLLMKNKYAVDSEKVREYFPLDRVVDGLFSITQSLYGLEYRDITETAESQGWPLWHEEVKLFEVVDTASGDLLGRFYLDLHPRANKYSHAAQWGLIPRKRWPDGAIEKPLAALVCNFTKPTADKPSLLTHDEVETFFHEFGHCLHTILTEANYGRLAGTSVERDFVEAPSQMFENWVWDADVLKTFARHYKTGETLPDDLLRGMVNARYIGSGMKAEHQFYYGLVDFTYHTAPKGEVDSTSVGLDLFEEIELYEAVPETYFQAAFGHLVGYEAGYYGYMWSLVYAQDMFQRFKELGMLDPKAGMYYRRKILARGGTLDGLDLIRDYLGREPRMDAFLEHLGLKRSAGD